MKAQISDSSWRQAESGWRWLSREHFATVRPTRAIRRAMATALAWPPDAIDRLERGETPEAFHANPPESPAAPPGPPAEREASLPEGSAAASGVDLSSLSPEEVAEIRGYINGIRSRRR